MTGTGNLRLWLVLLAAICLLTGGCLPARQRLYEEVITNRREAYKLWRDGELAPPHGARREDLTPALEGEMTLQDALKLAMLYNPSLRAVLEEKEKARGRVTESYSEALPKLTATATYRRLDEVAGFDVGGRSVSLGAPNNYSTDLTVSQPLFKGGAISAALLAARLYAYLADEAVRGAVQDVIYRVARAYYDVLLAEQVHQVTKEAWESATAHLRHVQKKQAAGMATEFDVLRAQVEVSNFEAAMIQQGNRRNLALTGLLRLIGASQRSHIQLSDQLTYRPVKPVLEEAVRIAYENRPDLYQAEFDVRLRRQALRIAKSKYWPTVEALFTQTWSRPDPHVSTADQWGRRWTASAVLSWPLFDGLRREGKIIQDRASLRQSRIRLRDAEQQALLEIRRALVDLRDAEKSVESQKLSLKSAREALRQVQVGYDNGIYTDLQVTDARAALTKAGSLYYEALHAHTVARLSLEKALGLLAPPPGVGEVPREPPAPASLEPFAASQQPVQQGTPDRGN